MAFIGVALRFMRLSSCGSRKGRPVRRFGAPDAVRLEKPRCVAIDRDFERAEQAAVNLPRRPERSAVPAEREDLLEPGHFRDPGEGADAAVESGSDKRADQPVANLAPADRAEVAAKAEAGDLVDAGAARHRPGAQLGIERPEDMRPAGAEQARRAEMLAVARGDNQIDRLLIVELVELEAPVDDRHVPFEQVDEDLLARLEHRAEAAILERVRHAARQD